VNLTTLFAGVFQVKWMMYWIVFALFSFIEVFADILISWQVATCYLYLPLKLLWDALSFEVKKCYRGSRMIVKHCLCRCWSQTACEWHYSCSQLHSW